jgi:hypothetical protein
MYQAWRVARSKGLNIVTPHARIAVPQMLGGPLKASWSRGLAISREYERVKG